MSKFKLFVRGLNTFSQISPQKRAIFEKFEPETCFDFLKISDIQTHIGQTFFLGFDKSQETNRIFKLGSNFDETKALRGVYAHGNSRALTRNSSLDIFSKYWKTNIRSQEIEEFSLPNELENGKIVSGFACVYYLSDDGRLYALGWNDHGKLGFGENVEKTMVFRHIPFYHRIVDIKAGMNFALVLDGMDNQTLDKFSGLVIRNSIKSQLI